jgi:DNA-binding NarL/FixJ family response regulator
VNRELSVLVVGPPHGVAEALAVACRRDRHLLVLGPVEHTGAAQGAIGLVAPDVVLVDLDSHPGSLDVIGLLRGSDPGRVYLGTTARADAALTAGVLNEGGLGLLARPFVGAQVRRDLLRALDGELLLPADHLAHVLETLDGGRRAERARVDTLTAREREVLGLLAEGLATNEIAGRLGISSFTVQAHVKSILSKLAVHSKVEAIRLAWRCRAVAVPA